MIHTRISKLRWQCENCNIMMTLNEQKTLVNQYLQAYNAMSVKKMIDCLDAKIVFENYQADQLTHRIIGLDGFEKQADEALAYFSERNQHVLHWEEKPDCLEVKIVFKATAAQNFPNGITKGQEIQFEGQSTFYFTNQKISKIIDRS